MSLRDSLGQRVTVTSYDAANGSFPTVYTGVLTEISRGHVHDDTYYYPGRAADMSLRRGPEMEFTIAIDQAEVRPRKTKTKTSAEFIAELLKNLPPIQYDYIPASLLDAAINKESTMNNDKYTATVIRDRASKSARIYLRLKDDAENGNERYLVAGSSSPVERSEGSEMPLFGSFPDEQFVPIIKAAMADYRDIQRDTFA